jgi:ADP-dependent phosphofructokinase/glucokinase
MYVSPKEIYNVFYRLEKTNIDYETKLESQHIKKINNKIQNQQRIREYPRKIIKLTQTIAFGSDF